MANTNINIRMDSELKRQFEAFCADMGMTMTTAFTIFAKKAVRENRIPFEISSERPRAALDTVQTAADEDVLALSRALIEKNKEAYLELATKMD